MIRAWCGLPALALLAAGAGSVLAAGAAAEAPALQPGDRGTARTALVGSEPQEIPLRFLGTYEDFAGPGYDLHLVELEGPEAERVGVASGMSGSPVYFDGKLIGALAYRLGSLPKSAVAGVTPIANMLEANLSRRPAARAGESAVTPIATPVMVAGMAPDVRDWLAPRLADLGLVLAAGGSGSSGGRLLPLLPGSPVGVELVRGDLRIAATGTVTWVDGDVVYAFGHPFLGGGPTEMPMVAAEVIHTLADSAGSVKLASVGSELGAIFEDRRAAIVGRLGGRARMIPVKLDVSGGDYGRQSFRFDVLRNSQLTPLLTAVSLLNALRSNNGYTDRSTVLLNGVIRLADLPDVELQMAYAGTSTADPSFGVATELLSTVDALWRNPFNEIGVESIELGIDVRPEVVSYRLEDLLYSREPIRPGETLEIICVLRRYRGDVIRKTLRIRLPGQLPGNGGLSLAVGSPTDVDRALGGVLAERFHSATDTASYVRVLGDLQPANRLTAVLYETGGTAVVRGTAYEALPPTAQRLLESQRTGDRRRGARSTPLGRAQIELDGPLAGLQRVRLRVERDLEAREEP